MFLDFKKLQRKRKILIVFSLVIFVSFLFPRLAFAQVENFFSLHCGAFDPICWALEALASVLIKFFVLLTFGIPLILSALFAGIMVLILGWIISPAFISLKFTNNAFVNAGLSITRGFSNLGFIVFLVAIGLATALRIEEYKAKKTLPILIIIALLINFSPVFCGIIIDASNIVMNFFLEKITGIEGFINIINQTGSSLMNLLFGSQFKIGAVIAAAVVVLVLIVFNFFAGFIFILFSALFIMRYIMLWILVILSPIAFVSYILPATRRGGSLLSWRKWWEQLVAWSIIGIIAGFFLYLGFFMIALINNNPRYFTCLPGDTNPDGTPKCGSGLGLMNNVVPYLIPLVLLWIAHRETRRTTALFAREIIEMPEKVAKSAVMVGAIAATGGAMVAGAAALKKAAGTLSSPEKFAKFRETHPTAAKLATPIATPLRWGRKQVEKGVPPEVVEKGFVPTVKEKVGIVTKPVKERVEEFAKEHIPEKFRKEFGGYFKAAGRGLKTALWERPKEEVKGGFREAWEDWKRRTGLRPPTEREERLGALISTLEREERLPTEEETRGFRELEEMQARGESDWRVYLEEVRRLRDEMRKAREREIALKPKRPKKEKLPPKEKKPLIKEIETKEIKEEEKKPPEEKKKEPRGWTGPGKRGTE